MVQSDALPEVLSLKLYHIHTNEKATIVFKRNGVYDRAGLAKLNSFLRDWRQERPTNMDPKLFDLLYQVYQQSGSTDYIHVVCGYRSPATNGMLRKRSRGVAKNSLHMQGKAVDFFIPGVALPKLRAIGLRMQIGGVGFYPTSGSPFVHMDTGSVRMWPRMTRQQLVGVFPNGRTLYVPSDGKPLPGYAQALASYRARKAGGTAIASFTDVPADTTQVASIADDSSGDAADDAATVTEVSAPAAIPQKTLAVAVASYATAPTPFPRLAPRRLTPSAIVAAAASAASASPAPQPAAPDRFIVVASVEPRVGTLAPDFDFGEPQDWSAPAVPSSLARAMADRDQARRGASLPIPPTAVVATIDVSRPLRAEAITTAVLRTGTEPLTALPNVLAYAAPDPVPVVKPHRAVMTSAGVPLPQMRPVRIIGTAQTAPVVRSVKLRAHLTAPDLMMTALDTQGLRLWIGAESTRQKSYAILTMPDFAQMPDLMEKPAVAFGSGFGAVAYANLRTDRFSGPLVQQPTMVDLTAEPQLASIR